MRLTFVDKRVMDYFTARLLFSSMNSKFSHRKKVNSRVNKAEYMAQDAPSTRLKKKHGTDGRTDGQTDGRTRPLIEMRRRI